MLFSYKQDKAENINLANDAAYKHTMDLLSRQLKDYRGKRFFIDKNNQQ